MWSWIQVYLASCSGSSSTLVSESGELILSPLGLYVGDGLDFEGKLTWDLSIEKCYHFFLLLGAGI
jgi:hypothetical protein